MSDPGTLREAQDPATPAARLAEIAAADPALGAEVAVHPNTYPELLDWIAQYGDDRARAAVAARRQPVADAAPPAVPIVAPVDPFAAPTAPHTAARIDPFGAPAAAPASPFGTAPSPAGAPAASGAKKRPKTGVIIAAAVVGALVVGGGITAAVVLPRVLPSASPEGAVDKLLNGAIGLDPLSLAGSLAPSEISALTSSLEKLQGIEIDDDDELSAHDSIERLRAALTVTLDELEYETDDIADGVERVSIVDGTIEIDGDEDEVIDAYLDLARLQYALSDMSERDIERQLDYTREGLEDSIDLPFEIDFRDYERDMGYPFSLVAVNEGTGWYVSPLLSYADVFYLSAERTDYLDVGRLGTRIPEPIVAEDAAHAVENTMLAALDTSAGKSYWEDLAATLPLAERRLVAIYGPAFGGNPWDRLTDDGGSIEVDSSDFVVVDGAHAVPDDVAVTWDYPRGDAYGEIYVDAQCAEWESTRRYYDSYWDEWDTSRDDGEACLDELPIDLDELGLAEPSLVATQEGGGWLFSPIATIGEWSAIATENLVRLSKEGDLDKLIRQR